MVDTATMTVVADSGVHRGLTIRANDWWPAARVKAILTDELAVHDVPCRAAAHWMSLRSTRRGWQIVIKCQSEGATIHPPTRGVLEEVAA